MRVLRSTWTGTPSDGESAFPRGPKISRRITGRKTLSDSGPKIGSRPRVLGHVHPVTTTRNASGDVTGPDTQLSGRSLNQPGISVMPSTRLKLRRMRRQDLTQIEHQYHGEYEDSDGKHRVTRHLDWGSAISVGRILCRSHTRSCRFLPNNSPCRRVVDRGTVCNCSILRLAPRYRHRRIPRGSAERRHLLA
jgi:hypothetical protein